MIGLNFMEIETNLEWQLILFDAMKGVEHHPANIRYSSNQFNILLRVI